MAIETFLARLDKVKPNGKRTYTALCPCHAENTPSLRITETPERNVIMRCFGCGANGEDVANALGIDVQELFYESRKTMTQQKTQVELEREQNRAFLDEVRDTVIDITPDCPVTKYLKSRGIKHIPDTIKFLPAYKQNGVYHPCMIARIDNNIIETVTKEINGVKKEFKQFQRISYHVTHLTHDGKKANVDAVKKPIAPEGELTGSSVKLFKHSGLLAVTEGIETALAVHDKTKMPCWALLNAQIMKTWSCPKDVKELHIIADMDRSFTGQASAYALAQRSAALIGKEGYQLQSVHVALLLKKEHDFELFTDSGSKFDYLDYANQTIE